MRKRQQYRPRPRVPRPAGMTGATAHDLSLEQQRLRVNPNPPTVWVARAVERERVVLWGAGAVGGAGRVRRLLSGRADRRRRRWGGARRHAGARQWSGRRGRAASSTPPRTSRPSPPRSAVRHGATREGGGGVASAPGPGRRGGTGLHVRGAVGPARLGAHPVPLAARSPSAGDAEERLATADK